MIPLVHAESEPPSIRRSIFWDIACTCVLKRSVFSSDILPYHMTRGVVGGRPGSTVMADAAMGATAKVPGTERALSAGSKLTQNGVLPQLGS